MSDFSVRRVLVPLALNELDGAAIRYAGHLCRMSGAERVYFMHVAESLDLPQEIRTEFPQIVETTEDVAERTMRQSVREHFGATGEIDIRYEVLDGTPLVAVLLATRKHDIDLIVMGRKPEHEWSGSLSERVTRKAPCSVLVVPSYAPESIQSILVPVDFSDRCWESLQAALSIARASGNLPVTCLHVYQVPIGYTHAGKTYEQFAAIMKANAEKACTAFLRNVQAGEVPLRTNFVLDEKPAVAIKRAIDMEKADLLVLAARGRTDSAALLLGSVTERCLRIAHVPVLAVKRKGDNMNFIEALLAI